MTVAEFTDYSRHIKAGDDATWLGQLIWYSVTEATRIEHATLKALLEANGLDANIPPVPRDDDVFRRVCTAAALKRMPTGTPDVFDNYLVRDVRRTAGRVWKHIVVETVDGNNKKLGYHPAVEIMFNSEASTIAVDPLFDYDRGIPGYQDTNADNMAKAIVSEFAAQRGNLNAYAIRELIRKTLLASNATAVRPGGGVYFVMQDHAMNVTSLEILASQIEGVDVHSLPLLDDGKQREMLRHAFEAETVGEIDATLADIEKILAGPEITSKRYGEMVASMNALRSKTKSYEELLEEEAGNTKFRLTIYEQKMKALLNHVKI